MLALLVRYDIREAVRDSWSFSDVPFKVVVPRSEGARVSVVWALAGVFKTGLAYTP